ncbi:hypothetical protein ACE1MK_13270 [Tenacibaculum maritimum]|uniref:hypothetical protein n=1 Tax=Tenacibaculum maritimum TaxID=107401 RepID=UPI0012E605E2|nr:hypothetical protein [Tenacibaculum maritimum]MCD9583285.1 hypothetical protein [Tenacibaculum maritimum]MCD9586243.1 hypothetical protein [Tenacibaculum maritimum]MCD9620609.1 hypothetical protein [Tenacibaculum maritimum]MCD9626015.1 hypothetical protein [Tenacibaculum maritimum]MCD9631519.1 hypothetical protein [Tenacibaculum maritimum]
MNDYIEQLKKDDSIEKRIDSEGNIYRIRVLGRGENLFFQENEKCLLCEIDARNAIIFIKSIKKWETKTKMSSEEKKRVINLVEKYYKEVYNPNVVLYNK